MCDPRKIQAQAIVQSNALAHSMVGNHQIECSCGMKMKRSEHAAHLKHYIHNSKLAKKAKREKKNQK
tara:strand:+ start:560 stop:760 length:201 start_codon:yes stop_codon:yes gene_type:complete